MNNFNISTTKKIYPDYDRIEDQEGVWFITRVTGLDRSVLVGYGRRKDISPGPMPSEHIIVDGFYEWCDKCRKHI